MPIPRTDVNKYSACQEELKNFKKFRDVGQKFSYMGIEMIVEGYYVDNVGGVYGNFSKAVLESAYVTRRGKLERVLFKYEHLPALLAENPECM